MESPDQAEVLGAAIWGILTGVYTSMPAEVVKWYPDDRQVDVQPTLKTKRVTGEVVSRPQVLRAPVFFPTGGGFTSTHPLAPGDEVYVVFSMRSLDRWIEKGGEVDPADGRKFSKNDAVVFAGISSKPSAQAVEDGLAFFGKLDGSSGLRVHDDGKVSLGTDTAETVALLHDVATRLKSVITALQSAVTADAILGPQPLDPATQTALGLALTELATTITKIETIKV